jgi:hypothetical protein
MTPIALTQRPHHRLFAAASAQPGSPGQASRPSEKKRTVSAVGSAETVLACSNASVLGYRLDNQQRET